MAPGCGVASSVFRRSKGKCFFSAFPFVSSLLFAVRVRENLARCHQSFVPITLMYQARAERSPN